MKSPMCFECNSEMSYLGEQRRSIKVRVGKGEIPRKERRFYHIWFCENGHKRREHYTRGRPQRFTIQIWQQHWRWHNWRWISYYTETSLIGAVRHIQEMKRWQFGPPKHIRLRDNWERKFIKCF